MGSIRKLDDVEDTRKGYHPFKPHRRQPLKKVPGMGPTRWDAYLGRWVVGPLTLEHEAFKY